MSSWLVALLIVALVAVVTLESTPTGPTTPRARSARRPRERSPGFRCPKCDAFRVAITGTLDLPGDMLNDEINLQAIACRECAFVGVAVYFESRRGSLDGEHWHHYGYRMPQADYDKLQAALGRCATRANRDCTCATHRRLGRQERGQWAGLYVLVREDPKGFNMEMERRD